MGAKKKEPNVLFQYVPYNLITVTRQRYHCLFVCLTLTFLNFLPLTPSFEPHVLISVLQAALDLVEKCEQEEEYCQSKLHLWQIG